ncbi:MAG: hypothetical protein M3Z54_01620 [Gemmatimonadota bacterium]|nr:hypothetical protein [Gemmatimonadota bacterium]
MARTKQEVEAENRELRDLIGDVYDRVSDYLDPEADIDEEDDEDDPEDADSGHGDL